MAYKCPWCGSLNTSRKIYSYGTHFVKGVVAVGGSIALDLMSNGAFSKQCSNAVGNAAEEWLKHGCYDYECKKCKKDFYVYYDERKNGKTEVTREPKI